MKYQKPIPDKSIRTNLEAIALYCEEAANGDKVLARKSAFLVVAQNLRALARGRYVTRLLDYME